MRRPRLSDQRGFTVVELLVAGVIGVVILGSATLIIAAAARQNNEVASRSDATQRGRLAMERIVRVLRSQACYGTVKTPVRSATADSVQVYADLKGGADPQLQTLTYDPSTKRLTQVSAPAATPGSTTTTVLASDVVPQGTTAVFRYFRYPASRPATGPYQPNEELAAPGTTDTALQRVARIDITFSTTGELRTTSNIKAAQTDSVVSRLADPNSGTPSPTC